MRDRLIELIDRADEECKHLKDCKSCSGYGKGSQCMNYHIADYLLDNGVIVPPCKVGDTVYEFFNVIGFYDINELVVENIVVGVNPQKCRIYTKSKRSNSKDIFYEDSFGKILFFSREAAENALKERERG